MPELDPRRHAFRPGLAAQELAGKVRADRFIDATAGWVKAGVVQVRQTPQVDAPTVTEFLRGEELRVFGEAEGWAWVQSTVDRYVGYLQAAQIEPGHPPRPNVWVEPMITFAYAEPDLRSRVVDLLPRHAALCTEEATAVETRGSRYLPVSGGGWVMDATLSDAPPCSPTLHQAALRYLEAPYRWGGKTFYGIDCSGLVQMAFRDLGMVVPRDSDMQRDELGVAEEMASPVELRPDDLLFTPGHVAIATGTAVVHADGVSMRVRCEPAELYWKRQAALGRRIEVHRLA